MARARKAIKLWLPELNDVVSVNRKQITQFGGGKYIEPIENFNNRSSLEYILGAVRQTRPMFGMPTVLYPGIVDKAAAVGW